MNADNHGAPGAPGADHFRNAATPFVMNAPA